MDLILPGATVYLGDCVERLRTVPDRSYEMCVTSPPYFGLRDYGHDGQIGLEDTPEQYIAKLVEVFREVRRVLADDGTLWVNIGDSYARDSRVRWDNSLHIEKDWKVDQAMRNAPNLVRDGVGYKPKDLIGIPWMLAFALRADGWYLRSEIIWHKPNPMPESVTDRPTKAHETLFLLSKQPKYFYDHEAVKEAAVGTSGGSSNSFKRDDSKRSVAHGSQNMGTHRPDRPDVAYDGATRNRRSVWTIPTRPYKGAHFAVFPPDLVEPCILAGTSEKGHCPGCGARWARQVEKGQSTYAQIKATGHDWKAMQEHAVANGMGLKAGAVSPGGTRLANGAVPHLVAASSLTTGWAATCTCNLPPIPDTVLDPFNGSGTTGQVALEHGRHYAGCELNADYLPLTDGRLRAVIAAKEKEQASQDAEAEEAARQPGLFDLLQTGT